MTLTGKRGIRARAARCLGAALLLAVFPGQGWSADTEVAAPASRLLNDPFAAFQARLSEKADEILLRTAAREPSGNGPDGREEVVATPAMDPAALQRFAQRFWGGEERPLHRAVQRVSELRTVVEPILKQEGVPPGMLGLMLVESGGDPWALSPKGARGLWQFMPATAQRYDLRVVHGTDDRLDVEKSTRAAARHLRDLHERFGSWSLALAAYNAGAGAVKQAVSRAGTADFATLSSLRLLPAETRAYVPAVLAAAPLFGSTGLERAERPRIRHATILYALPAATSAGIERERQIRRSQESAGLTRK